MCEKCAGPIRRSQSSSIPTPLQLRRPTTSFMRLVFQASTLICDPDGALNPSRYESLNA